ncbi:Ig-like domain-containing protein [Paenibacillus thalictri]|nr:Ig-like domain-containing protein [Paenibacillus thalictri]
MTSKTRNWVSLMMAVSLLWGILAFEMPRDVYADSAILAGDIVHEDFQSYPENSKLTANGWSHVENSSSGTVSVVKVPGKADASDQGLMINRSAVSGSADLLARRTLSAAQQGNIVVRANIMAKQTNAVVYALNIKGSGNDEIANILFTNGGKIAYQLPSGSYSTPETTLQSYSIDTWYDVMVVLDTQNQTFTIYIDGVKKKEGVSFKSAGATDFKTLDFQMFRLYTGTAYMDDLNIYTHHVLMSKSASVLEVGQIEQLTAAVSPALPAFQTVTWSSSDASVVSVDSSGLLKALRSGAAVIKAVSSGGASAECAVNVPEPPYVSLNSIGLDKPNVNLVEGGKAKINVTFDPSNAGNHPLVWKLTDETVASVTYDTYSRYAVITGGSPGVSNLTVTADDGHQAHAVVTVVPRGDLYSENFDSTAAGQFPSSLTAKSEVSAVTSVAEVPDEINKSLKMVKPSATANSLYAVRSFPDGLTKAKISLKAMAMQTNAIVYIPLVLNENNGNVTQIAFFSDGNISVRSDGAWKPLQSYEAGKWYAIDAVFNADAGWLDIYIDGVLAKSKVNFTDPSQWVKSMQLGMYRTDTGTAYFDDLNVYSFKALQNVAFTQSEEQLALGDSLSLSPLFTPADATFRSLVWTSSNPDVAAVDEHGVVTAKAVGNTTVTAVSTYNSSIAASVNISVAISHVVSVSVNPTSIQLPVNATKEHVVDLAFSPANASDKTVTWSSSNPNVAAVDVDGSLTTIGVGTATITVTSRDGNKTTSYEVTVVPRSVQASYYVSPQGSDDHAGSAAAPFRSLSKARAAVRQLNQNMTGDIVVYLAEGTYTLDETFQLDERDSGSNGYKVIYKALTPNHAPILSGGRQITGWQLHDPNKNIYKAYAGGNIETRQLYVNGARAIRARSNGGLTNPVRTSAGFTSDDTFLAGWGHISDMELVFKAEWTNPRDGVQSVTVQDGKAVITMKQPGWSAVTRRPSVTYPWTYENAYELLDEAGEWYLDRTTDTFYYKPRPGEEMNSAYIVAPTVEELVKIQGSSLNTPANHIQFEGITFAYTTWLRPNSDLGHADAQNNHLRYPPAPDVLPPAAVTIERAHNIDFERNEFSKLGITALKMAGGVQNSLIQGNRFYDVSGGAINVGDPTNSDPAIYNPSDVHLLMSNVDVLNNYIHDIGVEYRSAAAISAGFPVHMDISHNEMFNMPYSGLHVGYGWANIKSSAFADMKIENNFIHDLFGDGIYDGGAIYTIGGTGGTSEAPNLVRGNYIRNQMERYGAIYPDEGSSFWRYEHNVVDLSETPVWGAATNATWAHVGTSGIHDITFANNYTTTGYYVNRGTNVSFTGTIVVPDAVWPQEALQIMENAGLQLPYRDLASHTLERLIVPEQVSMQLGQAFELEIQAKSGKDSVIDLTAGAAQIYYESDNPSVVAVNAQGRIEALASGFASIKVSVKMGGVWTVRTVPVYVEDALERIEIRDVVDQSIELLEGMTQSLIPMGISRYGQNVELSDLSYVSSNPAIAVVTASGQVTAVNSGTAYITVAGTWDGVRKQVGIVVNVQGIHVVDYDGDYLYYDAYPLNDVIADSDHWFVNATGDNNKKTDAGTIEISTPGGFASYKGRMFENELLTFNMKINGTDGWPSVVLRGQKPNEPYLSETNDLYIIGFKPNEIELQRFNKGVRTVIFGNIDGATSIGGPAYPNTVMAFNTTHLVQAGAITESNGVRLLLYVDGQNIFNYLDSGEGNIATPGYLGLYARSGSITLGAVPKSAISGPNEIKVGEEAELNLSLDTDSNGMVMKDTAIRYDSQAFEFVGIQSLKPEINIGTVDDDHEGNVMVMLNGDSLSLSEPAAVFSITLRARQEKKDASAGIAYVTLQKSNGTIFRTAHDFAQITTDQTDLATRTGFRMQALSQVFRPN